MNEAVLKELATLQEPKPDIQDSRIFRRSVGHGMKVWRQQTRNFTYDILIEHITMECPHYVLTEKGPMMDRKESNDE